MIDEKITSRKIKIYFCFACCLVYLSSYLTRYNYAALLNSYITTGTIERTVAALISTVAFFTYFIGQGVSGLLGDKLNPSFLVSIGLGSSALCNILMFIFSGSSNLMIIIWGVNGFSQSMIWPPLIRTIAEFVDEISYRTIIKWIFIASSTGTVIVYLGAAGFIHFGVFQLLFILCGIIAIIAVIVWSIVVECIPQKERLKAKNEIITQRTKLNLKDPSLLLLLPIAIIMVLQGFLRDGISTWLPSLLTETVNMNTSFSALITAILPIFTIIYIKITDILKHKIDSENKIAAIYFSVVIFMLVGAILLNSVSAIIMAILISIASGCVHGINALFTGHLPIKFVGIGKVSFLTGFLNAFTYVGSIISVYGMGVVSEKHGWIVSILVWICVAILGLIVSFLAHKTNLVGKYLGGFSNVKEEHT